VKKRMFLFITPDGLTFSCPNKEYPDVENLQIIGWEEGNNEEDAFNNFLKNNKWLLETCFDRVICLEIKKGIDEAKVFSLKDYKVSSGRYL